MTELSQIASLHKPISDMLPSLAESLSYQNYTQHLALLETVCKRVCLYCISVVVYK